MRRRLGTILIAAGAVFLAYGAAVYFWHDPVTDVYARWKQHQLSGELEQAFQEFRGPVAPTQEASAASSGSSAADEAVDPDELALAVRTTAEAYYDQLELGQPLGRLIIPKLGIDPIFVNGTRWGADLTRGPGRYPESYLPGLGRTTAIAGHRTTFGAPLRYIDRLEADDEVTLELAYGTFVYRVVSHEIVEKDDWSILGRKQGDILVLSACHPLYGASQRWIVYASLERVETPEGATMRVGDGASLAAGAAP